MRCSPKEMVLFVRALDTQIHHLKTLTEDEREFIMSGKDEDMSNRLQCIEIN